MRLLLISDTYPPDVNGVARTLRTLAVGLVERGHVVEVVTTLAANDETTQADEHVRRHVMLSVPLPGYAGLRVGLATSGQLEGLIEEFQPEVLYVATETPLGLAAIRAAGKTGVPVVSGFHTNFQVYLEDYHMPGLEAVAESFLRNVHNQTARTLTPSADTAATLERWGIRNVGVLGRGVDTSLFNPAKRDASLRATWGADEKTPVAIYVGRVAAEKNLPLTVKSFEAFREVHPGAPCVVVGDGPRLKGLQMEQPDFHYAGTRVGDELAAHYASADIFVFPSLSETFGNVVLEAMASGLVAVGFDYAAARLLIRSGHNGWSARFGSEDDFLEQVRRAAHAWDDAEMHKAARKAALDLSWKRVIEQFEQELLAVTAPAATPTPNDPA